MAKPLSPIRIARIRRTSVVNSEETQELDFALGLRQGVEIFAVEFGIRGFTHVPVNDSLDFDSFHMALHAETGGLEGGIDAFPADNFILNSEIIAETTLQVTSFTSSVPSTSPDVINAFWMQPLVWNYIEIFGRALTLAQNLTFRAITSNAVFNVNGPQATIYYRYVELTTAELAEQFALRR